MKTVDIILLISSIASMIFCTVLFIRLRKLRNNKKNSLVTEDKSDGLECVYLFDFKNYASEYNENRISFITHSSYTVQGRITAGSSDTSEPTSDTTIRTGMFGNVPDDKFVMVKPKDVLHELETVPTPFTLTLLDEKIKILKDKEKLINQHYAKREVSALKERMENRKQYLKHKAFFDRFDNTTDEKIDALLTKYGLVMKTSDIFIPEFPDEAIIIMNEYTEKVHEICGKKPVFYVIAQEDKFKEAYKKRDPILLVQSPFGFYWQILGAWDEEMLILSEL